MAHSVVQRPEFLAKPCLLSSSQARHARWFPVFSPAVMGIVRLEGLQGIKGSENSEVGVGVIGLWSTKCCRARGEMRGGRSLGTRELLLCVSQHVVVPFTIQIIEITGFWVVAVSTGDPSHMYIESADHSVSLEERFVAFGM